MEFKFRNLLFVFLLIFTVGMNAENNTTTDETSIVILTPQKPYGPRMPSRIFIECHISFGHISFVMPTDVISMEVSIKDGEDVLWEGVVTQQTPKVAIPTFASGTYDIICRTDGNQVFHGYLTY